MFFVIVLLGVIVWLLWTLHQDLLEANQRQRNVKMELIRLVDRIEQLVEQKRKPAAPVPVVAPVGLNSASKATLRTLPKVGAIVAERIIAARPIKTLDQLRDVEGVTNSLYQSLQGKVNLD